MGPTLTVAGQLPPSFRTGFGWAEEFERELFLDGAPTMAVYRLDEVEGSLSRLDPDEVSVGHDVTVSFDDGGLFHGHRVEVSLSAELAPTGAWFDG
jgi:hypothetical protein